MKMVTSRRGRNDKRVGSEQVRRARISRVAMSVRGINSTNRSMDPDKLPTRKLAFILMYPE